jgi:hypothetical protein
MTMLRKNTSIPKSNDDYDNHNDNHDKHNRNNNDRNAGFSNFLIEQYSIKVMNTTSKL